MLSPGNVPAAGRRVVVVAMVVPHLLRRRRPHVGDYRRGDPRLTTGAEVPAARRNGPTTDPDSRRRFKVLREVGEVLFAREAGSEPGGGGGGRGGLPPGGPVNLQSINQSINRSIN